MANVLQNLSDFKSSSCWAGFSYVVLYISLIISIAVYVVDTFTAINLIAFDRWAGQVKPTIPFTISRWIFAGCIIVSFILLIYRWWRAIRVMRAGGVAQSYLDPLAVRLQSIRVGQRGRGWRRFLVFAELTKSKKGADYVALFTYFSFEGKLPSSICICCSSLTLCSLASSGLCRRTSTSRERPHPLVGHAAKSPTSRRTQDH